MSTNVTLHDKRDLIRKIRMALFSAHLHGKKDLMDVPSKVPLVWESQINILGIQNFLVAM